MFKRQAILRLIFYLTAATIGLLIGIAEVYFEVSLIPTNWGENGIYPKEHTIPDANPLKKMLLYKLLVLKVLRQNQTRYTNQIVTAIVLSTLCLLVFEKRRVLVINLQQLIRR